MIRKKSIGTSNGVEKTNEEWKKILRPEVYHVTREGGTEIPFTGELLHNKEAEIYTCSNCGLELFSSDAKFSPNLIQVPVGQVLTLRFLALWNFTQTIP